MTINDFTKFFDGCYKINNDGFFDVDIYSSDSMKYNIIIYSDNKTIYTVKIDKIECVDSSYNYYDCSFINNHNNIIGFSRFNDFAQTVNFDNFSINLNTEKINIYVNYETFINFMNTHYFIKSNK